MIKPLDTAGDTIVEVLIAIAIVSLVLGGAYSSARSSLTASLQAQERGEATKFVAQQLERLKVAANDPTKGIYSIAATGPYCLDDTLTRVTGAPCALGTDGRYRLSITRAGVGTARLFTIRADWDRAGGGPDGGLDQITTNYRMYEGVR